MTNKTLITVSEAAKMLGVTALTLRNWDKKGRLKALRHPMNNYRVYHLSDIERILKDMNDGKQAVYIPPKKKQRKLQIRHM